MTGESGPIDPEDMAAPEDRSDLADAYPAADGSTDAKDALLEAMLPNVLFDGWSEPALAAGGRDLALEPDEIDRLFPQGATEARLWFADWADRRMLSALALMDLGSMRMRDRIATALRTRLAILTPHREAVRRAITARMTPQGAVAAARSVHTTVDRIWYAAGDTSTDSSWYSKRALLGIVYTAAVLYWLGDSSAETVDTADFIDRRLDDVMKLGRLGSPLRNLRQMVVTPLETLRHELRR